MIVRFKIDNNFLIRGEWYKVIESNDVFHGKFRGVSKFEQLHQDILDAFCVYELENHTHKIWTSNWFHHSNFYTQEELREEKISEILTF
jgi:hypothetical protein